jgi:hypothetical protein
MEPVELRDLDAARRFVAEGLWLQRAVKPTAASVPPILEWAMEIASGGHPLPPVGFVADVGHIAFGNDSEHRMKEPLHVPGWPPALGRMYEDHVLGKLYADPMFERAGDALQKYQGKDRTKGLAYLVNQLRERIQVGGVHLPPAVIRTLLAANPNEVLTSAWDGLMRDGPSPLLVTMYEELVAAARRMSEALVKEDIEALEDRSALGDMGQYVALRQIRRTTASLLSRLPARPVRPYPNRREVPTRVLDEDQYPVGGYTSISTKGSIESLLHSQLAYIEDQADEPDLFDLKYARDELFYYSRDENQFLRRRRAFVFILFPDLTAARFKDPELASQRIVMLQSTVLALVEKLTEWLSTDAIRFEVLFVRDGEKDPLAEEATLMRLLLHEHIERGDGLVMSLADPAAVVQRLNMLSREAQVHCLASATEPFEMEIETAVVTELVVSGPRPMVGDGDGMVAPLDGEDAFDVWQETLLRILQLWV